MPSLAPAPNPTQLLLNAFRPDQTPATWEADRVRLNADWNDLAVRALVLGLAPQLHGQLAAWGVAPPSRAATKLAASYWASAQRNAEIYQQLSEALVAFQAQGLRPIALKGVHLAATTYPDPALRPMNDIDLLFTPEELPQAESILGGLGYRGKYKSPTLGAGVTKHTSTFRRDSAGAAPRNDSTPNPYLSPEARRLIEPHSTLEESWFGLKVDITPGVRERALVAELRGSQCCVLAPEDLLLQLCVHFCFHLIMGAPAMVQLVDLLAVTQAGQLDWETFSQRAGERRADPYALAALTLAEALLGAPVPAQVRQALAQATPGALRQRIEALGLTDVLRRTQQKPLTTLAQRLARGFADRAETARWAPDWRSRWRVWRTALNVFATDTGRMLLGKKLKTQIRNSKLPKPTL